MGERRLGHRCIAYVEEGEQGARDGCTGSRGQYGFRT